MLKSNNATVNYVSLKGNSSGDIDHHQRHKTINDVMHRSNRANTNDSVLFDLNKPRSLNFSNIKSKNTKFNKVDLKRNTNTFATYGTHDRQTLYSQTVSDKFSKKRFERLNFEFTSTEVKHRETWNKRNDWFGKTIQARGLWKWCMCFTIGAFTGTCMFLISIAIEALIGVNLSWAQNGLKISFAMGFARFLGVNCLFALISGSMVSFIAPSAAGSGIPAVKGWLNGSSIPGLFQMKTFIVKLVGVIFSVSAKFIIGKEGPMVHAGSALASGLALGRNKTVEFDTKTGYSFRNDVDSRDLISCGASAGVAAAFGAPIGGMLFALEEVASFWLPGLTWRAFFAAAVSNLVLTLALGCFHGNCGTASKTSLINFERSTDMVNGKYNYIEFSFFIVMGAIGGLIGAAFNGINVKICYWRKKYLKKPILRLWEVLFMAVFTTTLLIATPLMLPCKPVPDANTINTDNAFGINLNSNTTCYGVVTGDSGRYTCAEGYYNPLSSLLLQSSEDVIKGLFMFDSTCWDNLTLWLAGIVYFILAVITYGLSIPSGLFIPLILIGSNVGHVVGAYWNVLFQDNFDVGTYSLIGASAVLGGSTRMTISLTAIVMEITNDIYFLMPIMITIMVSKWIGDFFNEALYDAHVRLKDIPYLEPKISSFVPSYICAQDIMRPDIVTLPSVIDLQSLLDILNNPQNHHQAFPVIDMRNKSVKWLADQGWDQKEGNYIGMVLRWHIYIMLHRGCFSETNDPTFKHYKPAILKRSDLTERVWKNKKTLFAAEFGLPESELSLRYIDFTPYMSLSPTAVHRNTPVLTLYNLFKGIGLRHLVVIGNKREIVGIITTHELNEENLEEAVERVHHYFEHESESEQNELFEQRIAFLKGYTKSLQTSGNAWLLNKQDAPNAHGKKREQYNKHSILSNLDDGDSKQEKSNVLSKSVTTSIPSIQPQLSQHEPGEDYDEDNKTDTEYDEITANESQNTKAIQEDDENID